jgi:hypothetical protein
MSFNLLKRPHFCLETNPKRGAAMKIKTGYSRNPLHSRLEHQYDCCFAGLEFPADIVTNVRQICHIFWFLERKGIGISLRSSAVLQASASTIIFS